MKNQFAQVIAPVLTQVDQFPWDDRYLYGQYLAQTHYYVCHSTRLLAKGAGLFSQADEALHRTYLKHALEEKGHQQMLLQDLGHLGFKIDDFPELPAAGFVYQTQYYKVENEDPASFFGYILALEGMAAERGLPTYEKIKEYYGANCGVFLKVHGVVDQTHVEEAFEMIAPLSAARQELILTNLKLSCRALENFFLDIRATARNKNAVKQAA